MTTVIIPGCSVMKVKVASQALLFLTLFMARYTVATSSLITTLEDAGKI